ncbi:hypothetical protein ACI65C_010454 [Semiaphis heraclei]
MMVLDSGQASPSLRLYAAAAAAAANSYGGAATATSGGAGQQSGGGTGGVQMPPHPLFPHFAARFPHGMASAASFAAAGLSPYCGTRVVKDPWKKTYSVVDIRQRGGQAIISIVIQL